MRFFLAVLCFSIALVASAEIYKWTDSDGKIHFGDQRPNAAHVEKVHVQINSYTHVTYQLPPSIPDSAPKSSKNVVMYSTAWCGYCKKARAYFAERNIPYTDYDVENSQDGKERYTAIGGQGVPIIFVGQARMNGFSAEGFESLYRQ